MARKRSLPDYVFSVRARGRTYIYFQRGRSTPLAGPRVRLPDDPRSLEFWEAYRKLAGLDPVPKGVNPKSFAALIEAFKGSPEFSEKSAATQRQYARHCQLFVSWWGDLEVSGLLPAHVLKARDRLRATPAEANGVIRSLSALLSWSVPRGFRSDNPCEHVRKLKTGDGWSPWPWEMIEWARENCPPWMWHAIALAVYTGQRQADVLAMRRSIRTDGLIAVKQSKTGTELLIPIHRELAAVIAEMPAEALTYLNRNGRPWNQESFRTAWQREVPRQIKDAGLVFHGLRKSAVVTLLEAGCTDAEVAAITGQSRQMVEHYARRVNQQKLAKRAILRWETEGGNIR